MAFKEIADTAVDNFDRKVLEQYLKYLADGGDEDEFFKGRFNLFEGREDTNYIIIDSDGNIVRPDEDHNELVREKIREAELELHRRSQEVQGTD